MRALAAAAAALLAAQLSGCAAGAGESGYQGAVRLGAWQPTGSPGASGRLAGELGLGRTLLPHLAGEVGLGYYGARGPVALPAADGGAPVQLELNRDVLSLTGSLRLFRELGRAELWLAAGGGGYREEWRVPGGTPVIAPGPRIQLGGQVGAGAVWRFSEDLGLGVEARWLRTVPSWTHAQQRVEGVAGLASFSFRF